MSMGFNSCLSDHLSRVQAEDIINLSTKVEQGQSTKSRQAHSTALCGDWVLHNDDLSDCKCACTNGDY